MDFLSGEKKVLLEDYFSRLFTHSKDRKNKKLVEAIHYSLLSEGKRFRPALAILIAEILCAPMQRVLPWAAAVEMVHCYSLVHDDLPGMDNDDFRRGKPTNHKVFGEAHAILAGDALLTEAFAHLSREYRSVPAVGLELVNLLSTAAGLEGMVGGQAMDMEWSQSNSFTQERPIGELEETHRLKTGALIAVSSEGAAVACGAQPQEREALKRYGEHLGLAFQLADDLIDFDPERPEKTSFVTCYGRDNTRNRLNQECSQAIHCLEIFSGTFVSQSPLVALVEFNQRRALY